MGRRARVIVLGSVVVCCFLVGCGGDSKTVTETVEVETRTTSETGGGDGEPLDDVTKFCSSPEGEEIQALSAEAGQALEAEDDATLRATVAKMIAVAEDSPPGARCIYAPFDSVKGLLYQHPDLIREISKVQQERELTEADVERIESE
jgi:hypothetical protein